MAFYKQDIVDINLNTGSIFRSFLNHSIGFKNDDADRFGIRCFRDGEPVDLSGASCQAFFMRPDGSNLALTSYGTVSGNVAYVTLPQACYDYEGQFCLSIQLVGGGVTGTMRIVDGMVVNTGASGAVAPTASVPTYQEILAVYDSMVETLEDYQGVVDGQNTKIDELKSALNEYKDVDEKGVLQTIDIEWDEITGSISRSTLWGMNKVYPKGWVEYIKVRVAVGGQGVWVVLYSTDGNMRQVKNIPEIANVPAGDCYIPVHDYIRENFYVFVMARTAIVTVNNPTYKSKIYTQSSFDSNIQFAIGVIYDENSVFEFSDSNFQWIKNVAVFDDNYKQYALTYVWKNSNGYGYYFRLEGSNDGVTWTNVSNLSGESGIALSGFQTYKDTKFSVTVCWDEQTDTSFADDRRKLIKIIGANPQPLIDASIALNESPFEYYYDWENLTWIKDIQIKDTNYKYYSLSYVWHNSGGYYYYFRVNGSNDRTTWVNISNLEKQTAPATIPDIEIIQDSTISIVVDWTNAPETYYENGYKIIKPINCAHVNSTLLANDMPTAGYAVKDETKHVIVLDCLGNGDFTTVADAFDYVRSQNPSISNQFEIVVKPGRYSSLHNIVPPFTHVHGMYPDTVVITSEDYAGESTQPPLNQDFGSSKLSNLHIISDTGYCIHYDEGLNGCMVVNENLILEHKSPNNQSIIGGGSFLYGTLFEWNNCTFINGNVPCHTNRHGYMNTKVVFNNCKFVNAYLRCGSVGGYGDLVFEVNNSVFKLSGDIYTGKYALIGWQDDWATYTDPTLYFANTTEWIVSGHGNKNFLPLLQSNGTGLMIETKNVNEQISVSGSAVPVLFGYAKLRQGNARIKGRAYGVYRVQDKKAGDVRGKEGIDVFQMWKRLGDCSTNNLTLTVTVDGTSKTYTFDQDYTSSKPSMTTILAAINAVITNATISAYTPECWDNVMTDEKTYVIASGSNGVLKGEYVRIDGTVCQANDPIGSVYGRALEDGAAGEIVQVWIGNKFAVSLADGQYGIGSDGTLSIAATEKIGYVSGGVFIRNN